MSASSQTYVSSSAGTHLAAIHVFVPLGLGWMVMEQPAAVSTLLLSYFAYKLLNVLDLNDGAIILGTVTSKSIFIRYTDPRHLFLELKDS